MTTKERVGALPAAGVLIGFFVGAALVGLLLGDAIAPWVGIGLVVLLVSYCWARPSGGWNVFWIASLPNFAGLLLHDLAGAPKWVAVVFVPVAVWMARDEDREKRDAEDGSHAGSPDAA